MTRCSKQGTLTAPAFTACLLHVLRHFFQFGHGLLHNGLDDGDDGDDDDGDDGDGGGDDDDDDDADAGGDDDDDDEEHDLSLASPDSPALCMASP